MTRALPRFPIAVALGAAALAALVGAGALDGLTRAAQAQGTTIERIQADNACYVRLPDMPPTNLGAGRYGGHGAYNPKTGVLAYAGGADKATDENTRVFYQLYGIKLDGSGSWSNIPYGSSVGYQQAADKGCRELASIQIDDTNSVSVFGKDGCDNKAFGSSGGDIKELQVGDRASTAGVKWVANSGANSLPPDLEAVDGALIRLFAAWDSERDRIIFGQGTFNDEKESESQDKIYSARKVGSKFQISQMRPTGPVPARRFGTCAAYIQDKDAGVDGVFVLGGQEGAPENIPATTYAEVWWLDFSKSASNGEWVDISGRFTNLKKDAANPDAPYLGGRREGACAYDAETKTFYSWMGRASSSIPDGASHSAGAWRVDLSQLGDPNAKLSWERLAKDNLPGVKGRRLFPSVWDPANKRMFAIGGRNNLDAYQDVWAIYPDVTGEACATLDPYAPFRPGAPTPTATSAGPTNTPNPNITPSPTVPPTATLPPADRARACPGLDSRVPQSVISASLANPDSVQGWDMLCHPNLPPSPANGVRTWLTLQSTSKPWHPLFNPAIYRCGCP